jgi:peptidoglycan/LPS O-acetylase OafA/YrhL
MAHSQRPVTSATAFSSLLAALVNDTRVGSELASELSLERSQRRRPMTRHMPQLDGLRAIAVLSVVAYHTLPAPHLPVYLGPAAVRLFFVLSGFLITGILLSARDATGNRRGVLAAFYGRRLLRIFPLYYAALLTFAALGVREIREHLAWHALYLSNVLISVMDHWIGPASHLWSLCVEEQFYLCWPLLVLFLPRRLVPYACAAGIGAALTYRGVALDVTGNWFLSQFTLPACLDTLCLGGLLAWTQHSRRDTRVAGQVCLLTGLVLTTSLWFTDYRSLYATVLRDFGTGLIFVWIVDRASHGISGAAGRLLEWRPLRGVGTISYGIYVLHGLLPAVAPEIWPQERGLLQFLTVAAASILAAAISWRWLESPLNALKRHLPYDRPRALDRLRASTACTSFQAPIARGLQTSRNFGVDPSAP